MSSDEAKTDPPPDPVLACLNDLTSAMERQAESIGIVARHCSAIDHAVDGAIKAFAEQHGRREAAEVEASKERHRVERTLDMILHEVRKIGGRLATVEHEVDELKAHVLATNGNGNGKA